MAKMNMERAIGKTGLRMIERAKQHPDRLVAATITHGRGCRRGGEGWREYEAANKLVAAGLAEVVRRKRSKHTRHGWTRVQNQVVIRVY